MPYQEDARGLPLPNIQPWPFGVPLGSTPPFPRKWGLPPQPGAPPAPAPAPPMPSPASQVPPPMAGPGSDRMPPPGGPTLPTVGQGGVGPDIPPGALSGPPPGDPGLRRVYDNPATPPPASAAPGGTGPGMLEQMFKDKDFGAALGKTVGALGGGGGAPKGPGPLLPSSIAGQDPTTASRANASKIFEELLKGRWQPPRRGGPPGMGM